MKNIKNNALLPKEIRDAFGDIVVASADPLSAIIDSAQEYAKNDIKNFP
jgi:hypothetical protein